MVAHGEAGWLRVVHQRDDLVRGHGARRVRTRRATWSVSEPGPWLPGVTTSLLMIAMSIAPPWVWLGSEVVIEVSRPQSIELMVASSHGR